ncbi:MAG: GreA/GreB family elongation factor [bacterium]|nr:GreA/GreB family elongation factor [bacterium]
MITTTDNKFYLSKEGLTKAKQEYNKLLEFKKSKTKGEVPAILHSEDVNPEYITFQEDLSILDARLAEYENILKNSEIIKSPSKEKRGEICLGAKIVCEVGGERDEFVIVGSLESNPSLGKISNVSPVGSTLLGHKAGDIVTVNSSIKVTYKVLKISY